MPCWAGYAVANRLLTIDTRPGARWLRLGVGAILGLGAASIGYYLWMVAIGPAGRWYCAVDLGAWAALIVAARRPRAVVHSAACSPRASRALQVAAAAVAVSAIAAIVLAGRSEPDGFSDAWEIWNLRARQIYNLGDDWRAAFASATQHPDYPLLVPTTNARLWTYAGSEIGASPRLVQAVFLGAIAAILTGALSQVRDTSAALLAVVLLLGNVRLLMLVVWQYADVALAGCVTAAIVLHALSHVDGSTNAATFCLAGAMAGLACWTKNEGWLALAAIGFAELARFGHRRQTWRRIAALAMGAALPVAVALAFKHSIPAGNDLAAGQNVHDTLAKLFDPARLTTILGAAFQQGWVALKAMGIAVLAGGLLLGRHSNSSTQRGAIVAATTMLGVIAAGYCGVYMITPHDLTWHLRTSMDRLILHLYPAAIWIFCLLVRSPQELLARDEPRSAASAPLRKAA
ncbi:MAG TPA: hypothetical protein VG713_04260 [Pirellulales bacterium]|nr:hypothetical protein [Pirellulales bacterium]